MSKILSRAQLQETLCRSLAAVDMAPILALRHRGDVFTLAAKDSKRLELLAQVRSGEGEPVELEIDIRAFRQQDGIQNRNFTRFKKSILRKLAKSFTGAPFLRDHNSNLLEARAGTIIKSAPESIDGGVAFVMTLRVTAPFAVEALLSGNLDRFSIGWDFPGLDTLECSACKCAIFSDCFHFPGDKLDDGSRVEFVFTEAEGVEVSAVSVPAVKGTGLQEIRSALSLAAGPTLEISRDQRRIRMKKIAKALGLKDDADESTICAGIGALTARAQSAEAQLSAEQAGHADTRSKLSASEERVSELSAADDARSIDALCAEFADRFPIARDAAGEALTSPLETQIRALAASDIDGARAMLSAMPSQAPQLGDVPASVSHATGVSATPQPAPGSIGQSENAKKQRKQLGLSEDDFAKHNYYNGSETEHLRSN